MKRILINLAIWIITIIAKYFPRTKNIWIFGSRFGQKYDENSKHLFEYVHREVKDIHAIWLTRNKVVYEHLKGKNLNVCYTFSISGFFYAFSAGFVFISVCLSDVNRYAVAGANVIQLWHGTPMRNNDLGLLGEDYARVIVASKEYLENEFLGSNDKFKFALTGYPKNDVMVASRRTHKTDQLRSRYQCKKMVMYLPTHRQRHGAEGCFKEVQEFDLFDFGFDFAELENTMRETESLFVIKMHPLQVFPDSSVKKQMAESKYFHLIDPDDPLEDVYEYLGDMDVLITDYSSVLFDYLLLNRPVIFAVFDYVNQLKLRSFRFPFEEITPGPKIYNWPELTVSLRKILHRKDEWEDFRRKVNERFNYYRDDRSSERVCMEMRSTFDI